MSKRRDDTWENGELSRSLKEARDSTTNNSSSSKKRSSKSSSSHTRDTEERSTREGSRERNKGDRDRESKSKHDRKRTDDDRRKENDKPSRSDKTERRDEGEGKSSDRKRHERGRNDDEMNGDNHKKHKDKSDKDRDKSKEQRHTTTRDSEKQREDKPKHRSHRGEEDESSSRKLREDRKQRQDDDDDERSRKKRNGESKPHRSERDSERKDRSRERSNERRRDGSDDKRRAEQKNKRDDRDRRKERHKRDENDEDLKKSSTDIKKRHDKVEDVRARRHREDDSKKITNLSSVPLSDLNRNASKIEHTNGQGEAGEDNYEDDFEDYEDDFEDEEGEDSASVRDENAEMKAIRQAMSEENRAVLSASHQAREPLKDESLDKSENQGRTFVNFTSAKRRQITEGAAAKSWKRGRELFSLIELDIVSFNMFELHPLKEYEMYIRNFGASHTKQVYTQCNDDNVDRDIQTDFIETVNRWSQHPADSMIGVKCCGTDTGDLDQNDVVINKQTDSRLGTFLQNAGQTMSILLEENVLKNAGARSKLTPVSLNFSEQMTQIVTDIPILYQRSVTHVEFSPFDPNLIICSFGEGGATNLHKHLSLKSMLCIWNINDPARPQKVLISESVPNVCCFSPFKPILAFSGSFDGSISVWDLRESSHLHSRVKQGRNEWIIRYPTYNTDGLPNVDNHQGPVTAMKALYSTIDSDKIQSQLSFQIVTLDEMGTVNFWIVVETSSTEICSESDLGLLPGGHVTLVKTSSLSVVPKNQYCNFRTTCLCFNDRSPNDILVGTDQGKVLQLSRYNQSGKHIIFQPKVEYPVEISSIDFSPFLNSHFVIGCQDGSIHLYSSSTQSPIMSWYDVTVGEGVNDVFWSCTRPSVIYIRTLSKLHIMDLSVNSHEPILSEHFTTSQLVTLALSSPKTAPKQQSVSSRKSTHILLGFADNRIEVYTPNKKLRKSTHQELNVLIEALSF